MTPLYRNIAIAAALVALPAVATAAAGPERVRALPGRIGHRVREMWEDDTVEGSVKRIAARIEELTDRIDEMRRPEPAPSALLGRLLALAGVTLLVPAAIAALVAPDRARALRDSAEDWWSGLREGDDAEAFDADAELRGLSERLATLTGHLDRQRESTFDTVTAAARKAD